ncbi:hypothetical protein HN011_009361 [Eciton burchellii]|nr:hypothetical protein HN011_009361 [Eciton burchellii]
MKRPSGKTSYLNLWREFLVFNTAVRRFGLNRRPRFRSLRFYLSYPDRVHRLRLETILAVSLINDIDNRDPSGMNVSTVFPEGYVDNERVHQSSTAARKQDKNSDEEERLRRK